MRTYRFCSPFLSLLIVGWIVFLGLDNNGVALAHCVNVKAFGAVGDGITDDTASIQAAINAVALLPKPIVCFPAGHYRLTYALRPEVDHLTLLGGDGAVLVADPDMAGLGAGFPEAILVDRDFPNPPQPVYGLTIQSLAFEVKNGFGTNWPISAAVIQLNNCEHCLVTDVSITYTGPTPKPGQLDGIATSQGTTGQIQHVTVDGIPKGGIYLASGTHDLIVDGCEAKNTRGPVGQVGFVIAGAHHVSVRHSRSHDNAGAGLLIVDQAGGPTTDVQVVASDFSYNGAEGIKLASIYDGLLPTRIQLTNVSAFNNASHGIFVEAGRDVSIDYPEVAGSSLAGIWLDNIPIGPTFATRTTGVQITNPSIYDNGRLGVVVPGIALRAVQQVVIRGGSVFRTAATSEQIYGIGLYRSPAGVPSDQVRIVQVDAIVGLQPPPVVTIDLQGLEDLAAAAHTGYYHIRGNGSPEGVLSAPAGSYYFDLVNQRPYKKGSGWGPTGWVAQP